MPYADPEERRRYAREWMARRRNEWFAEHGPCVRCGSSEDLQLDHRDPTDGTHAQGERMGNAKLTNEMVRVIRTRAANGDSKRGMAREYEVSEKLVRLVVKGDVWAHVKETSAHGEATSLEN